MTQPRNENFKYLAESLRALLEVENAVLMDKGSMTIENLLGYKIKLLEAFSDHLEQNVTQSFEDEILETVKTIKISLKMNTGLQQAQSLQDHSVIKDLEARLLGQAETGRHKCH